MKNCIECNHPLEDNAKLCPKCGSAQPDLQKKEDTHDCNAGRNDNKKASGNIIGENEECKISGKGRINKIEDVSEMFIKCAVSGKHLLAGRDNRVTCPQCKAVVADECFNQNAGRCFNCDKDALISYAEQVRKFLADGLIDGNERIELDNLALSLFIDLETKQIIESKEAESKSEWYRIDNYQLALKTLISIYEDDKLISGFETLSSLYKRSINNEGIASHYYLVKSIVQPDDYIEAYKNRHKRSVDVFWEDYWAFVPFMKSNRNEEEAKSVVNANKARFSDKKKDILVSEAIFHYLAYRKTQNINHLELAQNIYPNSDENVSYPLRYFTPLLAKLLSGDSDMDISDLFNDPLESFYMKYLFDYEKDADIKQKVEHADIKFTAYGYKLYAKDELVDKESKKYRGTYSGDIKNNKLDGKGKLVGKSGSLSQGSFKNGWRDGLVVVKEDDGSVYIGECKMNFCHGKGKSTFSNGAVYEGDWKYGQYDGFGKFTSPNGTSYEGEYSEGEITGKGKFIFADGSVYEGNLEDGQFHGFGIYKCRNSYVYEGEWKQGKFHGFGKHTGSNGYVYEGEWEDNMRNGYGKFTYANGSIYEGEWKDDEKNGQGKFTHADGGCYEGEWKDGKSKYE